MRRAGRRVFSLCEAALKARAGDSRQASGKAHPPTGGASKGGDVGHKISAGQKPRFVVKPYPTQAAPPHTPADAVKSPVAIQQASAAGPAPVTPSQAVAAATSPAAPATAASATNAQSLAPGGAPADAGAKSGGSSILVPLAGVAVATVAAGAAYMSLRCAP